MTLLKKHIRTVHGVLYKGGVKIIPANGSIRSIYSTEIRTNKRAANMDAMELAKALLNEQELDAKII